MTRINWPDGSAVTYALDLAGKPVTIAEEGGPVLATYAYDTWGRRTRLTRGNGVETRLTWDAASRLATMAQDPAGTAQDGSATFAWTAAGQLQSRTRTGAALWNWFGPAGPEIGYAPERLDRYAVIGLTTPVYSPAGELVAGEGGGASFAYDVEGKLRIADDGVTFRLVDYDPLGRLRRVGPDGRTLVHAGAQLMAEYDGATLARRHVFAPGLDEPLVTYAGGAKTWHVADERGSVVAATDAGGMVVTSWGYGPHGEPDSRGMAPVFGFTGALTLPQIGLTSMRARVDSHRLGRFLQPDPIGQAGGINLYDYAGGDPVNGWDPLGLRPMVLGPQQPPPSGVPGFPGYQGNPIVDGGFGPSMIGGGGGAGWLMSHADCSFYFAEARDCPGGGRGEGSGSEPVVVEPVTPPPAFCFSMTWRGLDALQKGAQLTQIGFASTSRWIPISKKVVAAAAVVDISTALIKQNLGDSDAPRNTLAGLLLGAGLGGVRRAADVAQAAGDLAEGATSATLQALATNDPCKGVSW